MHSGVPKIMAGLAVIVAGILILKALGNQLGLVVFFIGCGIAIAGGISLSQTGAKEIGN
ncbi:MAG TPA: hypothetical protein VGI39_06465 [Polyangiaceae bacterium]|jgi:hypothetical protein